MAQAVQVSITFGRRPENAATIALILLKASTLGPRFGGALVVGQPKCPVLAGGAARKVKEAV